MLFQIVDYPHALEWYSLSEKQPWSRSHFEKSFMFLKNLMKYEQAIAGLRALKKNNEP